jgi:CheY-like chemotaxis protein
MNGLKTSRVLVVDDKPEEAVPILKALGQLGVGTVFCTGQPDELPQEKFAGIRLLLLDMDLGTGAIEAKQIVGQTINVLKEILSAEANPLMIVVWTNKEDLVSDFQKVLRAELPNLRPGIVATMSKADFVDNLNAIAKQVNGILRANTPLDLICLWEQCVHDAATGTTGMLSGLIANDDGMPAVWSTQMLGMLAALVRASAGRALGTARSVLWALCESLTLVHFDRLGMVQEQRGHELQRHARPLKSAIQAGVTEEQQAVLNRMLLVEDVAKSDTRVRPGNVYVRPGTAKQGQFFADAVGISSKLLVGDFFTPLADKEYVALRERYANAEEGERQPAIPGDQESP